MTRQRANVLAGGTSAVSLALCAGAVFFMIRAWSVPTLPTEFGPKGFSIAFALVIGGVGAVVAVRRPSNPTGWIFCGLGFISGLMALGTEYARWALLEQEGRPVAALYAAWLQEWLWIPLVGGLGIVAAMFPDGLFLSRRWRIATSLSILAALVPTAINAIIPRLTIFTGFENPVGLGGAGMRDLAETSLALLLPLLLVGTAGVVVRYRRSRGEERQQLKWLALSMSMVVAMITLYAGIAATGGSNSESLDWAEYLTIVSFLAVPISIAFGVLKYRLYDIDIVINKAVVYGGLAAFITLVYAVVVAGIGAAIGTNSNAALSAIAAATVALAFQPARRRAQRLANRIVYGERATPYEVLADLGERLAFEYAAEDVLQRVAATLAAGIGAERVAVWLHVGSELRPAAVWPAGEHAATLALDGDTVPEELEGMRAFAVQHQSDILGAIGVRKPASDPVTPVDENLARNLAGQAGLVLRNVRLIEELRASRQRLVAAQDEERRRIERNIHDGAQQQLVALAVKIRLTQAMVGKDDAKVLASLATLETETADALENLRDLARGIYPPLLADQGLVAALQPQARRSSIPVSLSHDGVGRLPREIEAAVYFCVLEALQNVGKYAVATQVAVRLETDDGSLRFEVRDDGVGFDTGAAHGTGLTNMRDRLEALGGSLEVRSASGRGTTVSGSVPVDAAG